MGTVELIEGAMVTLADARTSALADSTIITAQAKRIAELEAQLPKPHHVGPWPYGTKGSNPRQTFNGLEQRYPVQFLTGRARGGGFGQFLDANTVGPLVPSDWEDLLQRPGFLLSTNLNLRYGVGNEKTSLVLQGILNGSHDATLTKEFQRVAALGGRILCEAPNSEANIQKKDGGWTPQNPDGSAQPSPPDPSNLIPAACYIIDLANAAGATNIEWGLSLTFRLFNDNRWQAYFTDALLSRIKWFCCDGYSRNLPTGNGWNTVSEMFDNFLSIAKSHGKRAALTEVGCDENPADPGYKARFIGTLSDYVAAHDILECVVWNHGDSAPPGGGYRFNTSAISDQAARDFVRRFQP